MHVVRIHDPGRQPPSWTDIIRPGEFVAFSKHADSGAPCDGKGAPFASISDATCTIFPALGDAERACAAAVESCPSLQFDIFDDAGRLNPPLLTIVHASRAATLEADPRVQERRRVIAWALLLSGVLTMGYGYWKHTERPMVFAGIIGINLVIAGGRILLLNLGVRETERERATRLARARHG